MALSDHLIVIKNLIVFGLPETMKLAIATISLSLCFGIILGIIRYYKIPVLDTILHIYAYICRGVPLMIVLLFMYAVLLRGTNFGISVLTIVLVESAYIMEIIKGGLSGIDKGQFEAAESQSISKVTMMLRIILPQAFLTTLPALIGEIVMLLKGTAVASTVGCMEMLRKAQLLLPKYSYPMIVYGYVLIIFFVLCHLLTMVGRSLEKNVVKKIKGETV